MVSYILNKFTIQRYLMHKWLKNSVVLSAKTLDLASGGSSYSNILKGNFSLLKADYNPKKNIDVVMDFNERFPFDDQSFQTILLLNAIYIAHKPQDVINECHRVLKGGGKVFITFPVVFNEIPEPKDYHRFTRDGINDLCSNFSEVKIIPIGNRIHSSLYIIEPLLKLKIFKVFYLALMMPFYIVNKKISTKFIDFPIFYAVELTK